MSSQASDAWRYQIPIDTFMSEPTIATSSSHLELSPTTADLVEHAYSDEHVAPKKVARPFEQATPDSTSLPNAHAKIWDIPVRVFHWLLVTLLISSYITNALGPSYFSYHLWSGYALIVLVVFRIIWGFTGTHHAQFRSFVRGPRSIYLYLKEFLRGNSKPSAGHNPLGAIMVIFLLGSLLVQGVTGLFSNDEIFNVGPLYGYIDNELSLQLTRLHGNLFYWILAAIGLHVAAVLFHVKVKREPLINAMIHGKKPLEHGEVGIDSSRVWLALGIVVVISVILAAVVWYAPVAVVDAGY